MVIICFIILITTTIYFCLRFFLLKKSVDETNRQLKEIIENIEENRIVKLTEPNKHIEELLVTVNHTLELIRQKLIYYTLREKILKEEIESISHDLRTPLTSVLGYIEIIDKGMLSEDSRESLETAKRRAQSLQRLISQFYDLSRLSSNDYKLRIEDVDVSRLLKESIMEHYASLEERNLNVSIKIPSKPMIVSADIGAVQRIFDNLLQNVRKYAKGALDIRMEADDNLLTIIFENDTEKIEEKNIERIFDRFYTFDNARGSENTGLGLTIAKHLVQDMNWDITADVVMKENCQWLKIILYIKSKSTIMK